MYELDRAERALRDHIAFAEERDLDSTYTRAWLALVLVYRGRWADGGALAAEVLAARAAAVTEITANVALGRLRARRGDPDEGALDAALACARPGEGLQRLRHVHAARAEAAWLSGDPESTRAGSPDRLSARARKAPSLVRRRARVLAVEGRSAGRDAAVDRRAVSPADRGPPRGRRRALAGSRVPV